MGELSMDNIDRSLGIPAGLMAASALLSEYPAGSVMPAARFNDLRQAMETGADNCRQCAHQFDCAKSYDELSGRTK